MVHLLIIKVNSKEIDGVPVTGTPVGSRTEFVDRVVFIILYLTHTLIIYTQTHAHTRYC